jgi:hypothetical protein
MAPPAARSDQPQGHGPGARLGDGGGHRPRTRSGSGAVLRARARPRSGDRNGFRARTRVRIRGRVGVGALPLRTRIRVRSWTPAATAANRGRQQALECRPEMRMPAVESRGIEVPAPLQIAHRRAAGWVRRQQLLGDELADVRRQRGSVDLGPDSRPPRQKIHPRPQITRDGGGVLVMVSDRACLRGEGRNDQQQDRAEPNPFTVRSVGTHLTLRQSTHDSPAWVLGPSRFVPRIAIFDRSRSVYRTPVFRRWRRIMRQGPGFVHPSFEIALIDYPYNLI